MNNRDRNIQSKSPLEARQSKEDKTNKLDQVKSSQYILSSPPLDLSNQIKDRAEKQRPDSQVKS